MTTILWHIFLRSNALFDLWNSYANRLDSSYFTGHLLATGDLLYQIKVLFSSR